MKPDRFRLLRLALTRRHRYRRYRAVTMALTLAVLFAVPLSGLARVDLFGGAHRALFRPVALEVGLAAIAAAIVGLYSATFAINLFAGRMFCGFGCPVGQLSRFADAVDAWAGDARRRRRSSLGLTGFAALLATSIALWWVAPAVFLAPGPVLLLTLASIALATAWAIFQARHYRWGFCEKLCPIGLYYSVVQTTSFVNVDYDPTAVCTACEACAGICPVGLEPRQLEALTPSPGGLAFIDLPGSARCLHCGACVEICEQMTRKQPGPAPMGFRTRRSPPGKGETARVGES